MRTNALNSLGSFRSLRRWLRFGLVPASKARRIAAEVATWEQALPTETAGRRGPGRATNLRNLPRNKTGHVFEMEFGDRLTLFVWRKKADQPQLNASRFAEFPSEVRQAFQAMHDKAPTPVLPTTNLHRKMQSGGGPSASR